MLILTYDIEDDALRTRFSKFIKTYGRRLQYSVYEIDNSPRYLDIITLELKNTFEKAFGQSDSVLIFSVKKDGEILRFGYAKNEESDLVMY
jgi:CRISPR-associated protein Cas2